MLSAVLALVFGAGILVVAVDAITASLVRLGTVLPVGGVLLAALVLGLDLDSVAVGVVAIRDGLPGTALGASVGAAVLLSTAGLGLAALAFPFTVRVPRALLGAAGASAGLAAALGLDGHLGRLDGAVLLAAVVPLVVWTVRTAPPSTATDGAPAAPRGSGPRLAVRLGLALVGLLVGAELLVHGVADAVGALGVSEARFGLLVVAAAVCLEELALEILPAGRGHPEVSVGNALGTVVFSLTVSLGLVSLVAPVPVAAEVVHWHLPALIAAVGSAVAVLWRGRMGRPEGAGLVALYAIYVGGALVVS